MVPGGGQRVQRFIGQIQLGFTKVPIIRVYLPLSGEEFQEYDLATYAYESAISEYRSAVV